MSSVSLPAIPRTTLGRSGIVSTRLGLGCSTWPLRCRYKEVVEIVAAALSAGIRFLDTAPLYGTEEIVGRALKDAGAPGDVVVATKACSYKDDLGIVYRDYSDRTVYRSVERSLKRLGVDRLDIVHIHDVEPENLEQMFSKEGALRALLELKSRGLIRSIGIAASTLQCLQAAIDSGEVDHIQAYHSYTLLNQEAQSLIPSIKTRNLSFLNVAPFAGHILSTGASPNAFYNYHPAAPEVIEAVRRLEQVCGRKDVSLSTAALAFSLSNPDVHVTVVGMDSPEKVCASVKALSTPLTGTDFAEMVSAAGGPHPLRRQYGGGKNPYKAGPAGFMSNFFPGHLVSVRL